MSDISLTIGLIGLFASVIGVLVSLWIVRKPKPLYAMQLAKLGGVKHPDITILFGEKKISNLYSIRLVFWNGGNKEIRKEDIPHPKAGPMIKVSSNSEILSYIAETTTGDKSGEFISTHNNLSIYFDYLNRGDAFLGEVYLTTKEDTMPEVNFLGTLKGSSISKGDIHNISKFHHLFFILTGVAFLFLTLMSGYAVYLAAISAHGQPMKASLFFLVVIVLTAIDFKFNIFSIPRKIPKKYQEFLETGQIKK